MVNTVLMGTFGGDLFGQNITKLFRSIKSKKKTLDIIKKYIFQHSFRSLPLKSYNEAFNENFYAKASRMLIMNYNRELNKKIKDKWANQIINLVDYWDYRICEPRWIFQAFQYINWYMETRHPFLDNELVDFFAFRLPIQMRLGEIFLQKAMNFCFPQLSGIPLENGSPPDSSRINFFLKRAKKFTRKEVSKLLEKASKGKLNMGGLDYREYGKWLRGGSKNYVFDILNQNRVTIEKYFKKEFLKKVLDEHMSATKNHDQLICDLLNFELLHKIFFNNIMELGK